MVHTPLSLPNCHTRRCLRCAGPMVVGFGYLGGARCRGCEREYQAWSLRRALKVGLVSIAIAAGLAIGFTGGICGALFFALVVPWEAARILLAFGAYLTIQVGAVAVGYRVAAGVADVISRAAFLRQRQPALPVARARLVSSSSSAGIHGWRGRP